MTDDIPQVPVFQLWSVYRKVHIYKYVRGKTPDGRTKWTYYAKVPTDKAVGGIDTIPLVANTQQSIRLQVGRVLNGLDPVDCRICVHYSPERCGLGGELEGYSCTAFEVRA